MCDTAVFLGPTLDLGRAQSIFRANYRPPVKRGDLLLLGEEVKTVGIIDGEFYQSLAVSPKEVLALLDRGVKVYGSSSMGALRAAETYPYGMVGIGAIFAMYRDGAIDADDEVALTYDPESYRPSSTPLVNIRFALKSAVLKGLIKEAKAVEIIARLKDIYFPSRSYQLVIQMCPELRDFLVLEAPDQKRDDAVLLLQILARDNKLPLSAVRHQATVDVLA